MINFDTTGSQKELEANLTSSKDMSLWTGTVLPAYDEGGFEFSMTSIWKIKTRLEGNLTSADVLLKTIPHVAMDWGCGGDTPQASSII